MINPWLPAITIFAFRFVAVSEESLKNKLFPPLTVIVGVPLERANVSVDHGPALPTTVVTRFRSLFVAPKLMDPRVVLRLKEISVVFASVLMSAEASTPLGTPPLQLVGVLKSTASVVFAEVAFGVTLNVPPGAL